MHPASEAALFDQSFDGPAQRALATKNCLNGPIGHNEPKRANDRLEILLSFHAPGNQHNWLAWRHAGFVSSGLRRRGYVVKGQTVWNHAPLHAFGRPLGPVAVTGLRIGHDGAGETRNFDAE